MAAGVLDADLAALLWLLIEARVPLLVAGPDRGVRDGLLSALTDFLPVGIARRVVGGEGEDFSWLPEAPELGWSGAAPGERGERADPSVTWLACAELGPDRLDGAWGAAARLLVRSLQLGYGLGSTIRAGSLQEVLARLGEPPLSLSSDELRRLGVVLVLGMDADDRLRLAAAHYLRPVERDGAGHLQRRPAAVLATHDPERDAFDHFWWGVMPDLAARAGRTAAGFEREQADRARLLRALASEGVTEPNAVRAAIASHRGGFMASHRHWRSSVG